MPNRSTPRRPMTPDEVRMARALGGCRFVPATFDKKFGQGIGAAASSADPQITEREAVLLRVKVHTYRRQIPADVVALATQEPPPFVVPPPPTNNLELPL